MEKVMGEWQTIETAPRDGTPVLLWYEISAGEISGISSAPGVGVGRFYNGRSDYPGDQWWSLDGGDAYASWCQPTHWMPLPAPPFIHPKVIDHRKAHLAHCNQGEYEGGCKYGEDDTCPALHP